MPSIFAHLGEKVVIMPNLTSCLLLPNFLQWKIICWANLLNEERNGWVELKVTKRIVVRIALIALFEHTCWFKVVKMQAYLIIWNLQLERADWLSKALKVLRYPNLEDHAVKRHSDLQASFQPDFILCYIDSTNLKLEEPHSKVISFFVANYSALLEGRFQYWRYSYCWNFDDHCLSSSSSD